MSLALTNVQGGQLAQEPAAKFHMGAVSGAMEERVVEFTDNFFAASTIPVATSRDASQASTLHTGVSGYTISDHGDLRSALGHSWTTHRPESSMLHYASLIAQNALLYKSGIPGPVIAVVNFVQLPIMGAEASIGDWFFPKKSLDHSIGRVGQEVHVSIKQAGAETRDVGTAIIKEFKSAAKELILEMKDQSVITVKEIGGQLQIIADHAIKKAFGDAEIFIKSSGETIRAITVQTSREASESAVRGAVYAFTDAVFGQNEREVLRRKISAYFLENPEAVEIKVRHLLSFIYSQNQVSLTAENKAILYEELVRAVNEPGDAFHHSERLYLLIGARALNDPDLYVVPSWIWTKKDPAMCVIEAIPPAGIRETLKSDTILEALEFFPDLQVEFENHPTKTERLIGQLLDSAEGTPVGSVNVFATEALPEGYLECDGRALSKEEFSELYAMLNDRYGETETEFNLPDYRGYFLRGWDHGAGRDPDVEKRKLQATQTGSEAVGTVQEDAFKAHSHAHDDWIVGPSGHELYQKGPPDGARLGEREEKTALSGEAETRPINTNVIFAIKAQPSKLDLGVAQLAEEVIELREESDAFHTVEQAQQAQISEMKARLDEMDSALDVYRNVVLGAVTAAVAGAVATKCLGSGQQQDFTDRN